MKIKSVFKNNSKMKNSKKRKKAVNPDGSMMIYSEEMPWFLQEAYKMLRTNLSFSLPGKECKVIGVTSAEASAGKSINTINCAISFGQLGKKVMLIDCDLRASSIALKLGVKGTPGLSDVLTGQAAINDAAQELKEYGISFIPAGTLPPDPTWLLQSEQFKGLIKTLRNYYDYVFIDLPPVLVVTDAAMISKRLDGFVLVVRDKSTQTPDIANMLSQLDMVDAKILGVIYNDVTHEKKSHYRGNYYYYYDKYSK